MIYDVVTHLDELLLADVEVCAMLSNFEGSPAIAFMSAPKGMQMPYMVTSVPGNASSGNYVTDEGIYSVDIYTSGGDMPTAVAIAKAVISLFDMSRLPPDLGMSMWKEWDTFIPEKDPSTAHYHIEFGLRHFQ